MYKDTVDDAGEPPSIADDPNFRARLSELDRGLEAAHPAADAADATAADAAAAPSGEPVKRTSPTAAPRARPAPRVVSSRRFPLPPSIVSPFDALTMNDPPAAAAAETADEEAVLRPLIDLFPPETPHERRAAIQPADAVPAALERRRPQSQPAHAPAPPSHVRPVTAESFYGFLEKPFSLSTDPHFFFHSTIHDPVGQQLLTAVRRREGLVVLTGDLGTGKTMLCRTVMEQLDRRTLTSLVADPFVSGEELLKTILVDFGVASRDQLARSEATRRELATTLLSFVESLAPLQASAIVFVDEAQSLPADVLEEIRVLVEAGEASSLLQVVLVGQPSLTALLRRREQAALQRRVTVRAALLPLPADEMDGYVMHRLSVAGGTPRVHFDQPALERIYRLSRGVPRVINLLCDRALTRGFEASASVIGASLVDAAAADLDLGEPRSSLARFASTAAIVAGLALCVLAGAGLAAWIFHDAFARTLALLRR